MPRLHDSRAAFGFLLFVALFAAGCPGSPPPVVAKPPSAVSPSEPLVIRQSKTGLGFRLSNADASADAPPPRNVAAATALAATEAKKLASRLPALASDPDDAKGFAMRDRSRPAPRAGKTVTEPFPPPATAPKATPAATGPLTVERHAPEGPVDLAPHLSITFSQPMIPVGTLSDIGEVKPPALLSPLPAGKWRWLGTRTLLFQPEKRFPMATEFAVEIPPGTKSQTGGTLAAAQRWTFTTPPPKVVRFHPSGTSVPLEALVFVELDQAIEPPSLLGSLELLAQGTPVGARLATAEEIDDDADVRRLAQQAEKGRWIALKPTSKLEAARGYEIRLRAGAPSAEGPRKTTSPQASTFQTFGAMRLVAGTCGWRSTTKDCKPLEDLHLRFTNPVEAEKFDKSMIAVTPEVPGLRVDVSGAYVTLRGRFKGRTRYAVTVRGALPDVHGQTLQKDATVDFDIGTADPVLFGAERDMVVLDPASPRAYTIYSINEPQLRTRVYAVEPRDWPAYEAFSQEWERPRKTRVPGRLVAERTLTTQKVADELVGTPVDLGPALTKGTGQAVVVVESTRTPPKGYERAEMHVWVQATELGLQAFVEREEVIGWVSRLGTGAAVAGAELSVLDAGGAPGRTDAGGIAKVPLASKGSLLVAKSGTDVAFLPQAWDAGTSAFAQQPVTDGTRWLVYDDRGMYKPGEDVRLKGFLRRAVMAKGGDLDTVPNVSGAALSFRVVDGRWAEIAKGTAKAEGDGSFDLSFKVPGNANTGDARVELSLAGATDHAHVFHIEEFRRPEFEVSARATEGPHVVGKHAVATVSAAYYAGGGLPAAPVTWRVSQETVPFSPPDRGDFHFGPEPASWWSRPARPKKDKPTSETWTAQTDGAGIHRLRLDFDAVDPPYPMKLDLVAEVVDVNRQQWAGRTGFLVHPADRTVGVRLAKSIVRAGENLDIDVVTTDLDGKAVAGRPVGVKLVKLETERRGSVWEDKEIEIGSCTVESKAAPQEISRCTLRTKEGGAYRVVATVTDDAGRRSQTDVRAWVFGDSSPKDRALDKSSAQLVVDKNDYAPGETAEVLVVAPFAPAEGVLTVRRQGVVTLERFSMTSSTQLVRVKLDEALVPNALLRVDLVGAAVRDDASGDPDPRLPKRPAYASGSVRVGILPTSRKLAVTAAAKARALEPGASTELTVDVKDPEGRPVRGASVAVAVVDEALLALSDYKTPDPMAVFYADRPPEVSDLELRDRVLLADPDVATLRNRAASGQLQQPGGGGRAYGVGRGAYPATAAPMPAPSASAPPERPKQAADTKRLALDDNMAEAKAESGANASVAKAGTPIKVRASFDALALWAPKGTTDAAGRAKVALKLPDNLTRYRVMAVVAAGTKMFGSGESTITARLPVMARLSAPRFLSFGDRFELPVVVQNQTDAPVDVALVARATNATIGEPAGKRVKVAANDRVEVRFSAAAEKAGTARFQVGVATESFSDASQVEVPVYTPATSEAFATYGELDEGAIAQPVQPPSNVFPQFGGLEITTSSTQLQALTDAFLYLVRYPYECNEQLSSRLVSVAALRDVLSAFKADGMPKPDAITAFAKEDMEKLKRRQKWDGGWGFWQEEPWPYLTVHVTHALVRAKEKGYTPDPSMMERAKGYLRAIESKYPHWYSNETRRAITAYALYVRKRMGDADPARARRLIAEAGGVDKLGMEAVGWIWPTISEDKASAAENEAIRRLVANRAEETAGAAHFTTSYGDGAWVLLHSDRRVDGILLEGLIGDQPQSTLIPKIVRGLLAHRKKGRWSNTQENAFVLLALDRYFATYEKVTPDFVARAWLGDRFAGQHAFKGRTTEQSEIAIPMAWIASEVKGPQSLVLGKEGPGRLYYRIGMQYAPTDLRPPATDQGFAVSRVYEGVDKPEDVRRDPDGTWRMKAGARVRSRVTMVAPARRYHVALVDPLPAGLEPMNPALAVTGEVPKDPPAEAQGGKYGAWQRTWYEHQNLRDERAEAFASLLWDGVWEYAWVARATTPGTFVVAPAKAEEMYSPEVFGRSAGDRVIVE